MNPVKLLKTRFLYLFCVFLLGIELCLLNPNRVMGVIALILSPILTFGLFTRYEKAEAIRRSRISSFSFFSSFLSSLLLEFPAEKAYEKANQYLVGYQELVPYEEIKENPERLNLYEFQDYFRKVITMEASDEVHLGDYLPLSESLEEKIRKEVSVTEENESALRKALAFLMVFFFLVLGLTIGNSSISELLKSNAYSIYSGLVLPLCYPSVLFLAARKGGSDA